MIIMPSDDKLKWIILYLIRIHLEDKNVPMPIKCIILMYAKRCIGCKLLSLCQDIDLFQMLTEHISGISNFQLLYRASDHNFSAELFKKNCIGSGKYGQIVIIKSNYGTIFGGYTSTDWTAQPSDCIRHDIYDSSAFIFLIQSDKKKYDDQCPMYFPVKSNEIACAIGYQSNFGPIFGCIDIYITDKCHEKQDSITCFKSFDNHGEEIVLCGGQENWESCYDERSRPFGLHGTFHVIDYQVFRVICADKKSF